MSYIGKKPSFSQVRTAELVVQRGTDITTAGTVAALDVSNISLVRLTAATVLQGLVAPSAPANNGKRVTLVNANSVSLAVANESGSATAANRISTGISRDLVITAGASVTLFYNTASSRWSVESSSSEINIDRLQVATEAIVLNSVDLAPTSSPKSGLIELTAGSQTSIRSISTGANGQFLAIINKTGSLLQIANEDAGATPADRVVTGTGGPISLQSNASLFLAYLGSASRWQVVGGTGSGGGATEQVTQTGIGSLAVGTPLYVDASTGWTAANASAANTAEVAGMLGRSLSANLAEVVMAGEVSGVAAAMFTEAVLPARGEVVFLSATSGKLTVTEPSVVGQVSKPLGVVHNVNGSTSVDIMFFNWRGSVVGGANARTTISLANSATTPVQNVSAYDAGELAGWVFIDATTDRRFYIQAQFAKNGAGTDFNISYQTTGDTPPAGFSMTVTSAGVIQVTLPSVAGFSSATINYALNAPAVGASLPLSIDSSALNIVDSAPLSYRNVIINGNFDIWQRGTTGNSDTSAGAYASADRWKIFGLEDGVSTTRCTLARTTDVPSGSRYSGKVSSNIAGTDVIGIVQYIEAANIAHAVGQTVTISAKIKKNALYDGTTPIEIALYYLNAADTGASNAIYVAGMTAITTYNHVPSSTDWQTITFSAVLPVGAANGVAVRFAYNKVNMGLGDVFSVTGVQLEVGSKSSAFERRPYGMELALCQRYYYKYTSPADYRVAVIRSNGGSTQGIPQSLPVPMRVTPIGTVLTQPSPAILRGLDDANPNVNYTTLTSAGLTHVEYYLSANASSANITQMLAFSCVLGFSAEL